MENEHQELVPEQVPEQVLTWAQPGPQSSHLVRTYELVAPLWDLKGLRSTNCFRPWFWPTGGFNKGLHSRTWNNVKMLG